MRHNATTVIFIFIGVSLIPFILLAAALFIYDPARMYHSGRDNYRLHTNLRIQIAGLVRNEEYESVIIGTSVLENSSANELSELLGSRFVNLSISAGDFYERGLIMSYMLKRRPIKDVVWSLDFIYLNQRRGYRVFPLRTYEFIYDDNPFNDIRLYLNKHFMTCLIRWSSSEECVGRIGTLDRPNAWDNDTDHVARFGGMRNWCIAIDHWQMRDVVEKLTTAVSRAATGKLDYSLGGANVVRAIAYVEDNLITLVKSYPETRFRLVFPPYSRAKFAIWHQQQPGAAEAHQAVIRYLAQKSEELPNLEIYGFEDQGFLDDIEHYKDLDHFATSINRHIAVALHDKRNLITAKNVDVYIDSASRRARDYNLAGLATSLAACKGQNSALVGRQ